MANRLEDIWKIGTTTPEAGDIPAGGFGVDIDNGRAFSAKADGDIFELGVAGPKGEDGDMGPKGEDGDMGPPGTTDHIMLLNVGTNTHLQIDTHLALVAKHIDWTITGPEDVHSSRYTDTDTDTVYDDTTVVAHMSAVDNPHAVTHAQTTGQTENDHHDKLHTHDGADGSGVIDHTKLTSVGTNTHAAIDAHIAAYNPYGGMKWKGPWTSTTYYENDVTRDGTYTGVANKDTTDRLAPQDVGIPYYLYTGTLSDFENTASQILYGNRYTATVAEKLIGYRIYVTEGDSYKVYLIKNPEGTAVATLLHNFTANSTGWLNIDASGTIIGAGFMFDIIVYATEPDSTPTISLLNYAYNKPNNSGTPAAGEMEHSKGDIANLKVHKTDDDGNDNSAFLEGLHIGDIIELETMRWSIQSIIDSGAYMTYQVNPAVQYGATGVYSIGFETIEATPISYGMEIDANIATPHSGLYIADGKWEDIIPNDNQYGVDIHVQEISISDDWDIIAASENVGSDATAAAAASGWTGVTTIGTDSNSKVIRVEDGLIVSIV